QPTGVAMEVGDVLRAQSAARFVPGTVANPIARVDRAWTPRAQVCVPRDVATPGRRRQQLAVCVGAGEPAEIGAVALADAGDEKRHRLRRSTCRCATRCALATTGAAARRLPLSLSRGGLLRQQQIG